MQACWQNPYGMEFSFLVGEMKLFSDFR